VAAPLSSLAKAIHIATFVRELQRISRHHVRKELFKTAFVCQELQSLLHGDAMVVVALGTAPQVTLDLPAVADLVAEGTFDPEPLFTSSPAPVAMEE
jgi:hypothetical protein